jgi:hypothetical protein
MDFLIALRQEVEITVRPITKNTVRYRLSLLDHHRAVTGLRTVIIFVDCQSLTLTSALQNLFRGRISPFRVEATPRTANASPEELSPNEF